MVSDLEVGIMAGFRYAATAQFKCTVRKENTGKEYREGRCRLTSFRLDTGHFAELSNAVKERYKFFFTYNRTIRSQSLVAIRRVAYCYKREGDTRLHVQTTTTW
jgi:hypothetical protein